MPRELKTAPSGRRRVADSHDAAPRLRHGRCHLCTSKNDERTEEFSADSAVSRNVWKNMSSRNDSTLKVFLFKSCAKVQLRPARHLCWKKQGNGNEEKVKNWQMSNDKSVPNSQRSMKK